MATALRFLLGLDAALQASLDCDDIVATTVRLLGTHLECACAYAKVDAAGRARVVRDHAARAPALPDDFDVDDLGSALAGPMRDGEVVHIDDGERDALSSDANVDAGGARSALAIPLLEGGRLAAAMVLRDERPRAWAPDDVDLAMLVAKRCFESIERMRAMREAKESAAQVRLVADNVPAKISYVDRTFHYRFNNAAYGDWYGVDTATIVGRHVRDVLGEATYLERLPYMQRALDGETVTFKSQGEHRRLGLRMTDITCVPDVAANGDVRGLFMMTVDTTERQRAEERLRENDRRKDEFLAMLAHELRNPLAPLSNALYLLPSVAHDAKRAEDLRALMERQVRHLARLLDDLLDVSRVSRGKIELRRRPLRLDEVLDRAVEGVRLVVERQRQTLAVAPTPPDLWLTGDAARLTQVFGNILGNAVKYTPEGGRITVTTGRDGANVVVRIRDNGRGIPPDMLERVFEMFVQAEPMLENPRGSMGIGLALSKLLVEMHGGTIVAQSDGIDRGTEIVVRLPLSDAPEATQPTPARAPGVADDDSANAALPKRRVLVVDDVEASASTLGEALRTMGHDALAVFSGRAALEAAPVFRPDTVFLDLAMPEMNGYEVARRLRATPEGRDVLLIALTGFAQEEDYRRTREAGFDHHLVKPASMQRIEALLGDATPVQ